jgi:hypothetical protein
MRLVNTQHHHNEEGEATSTLLVCVLKLHYHSMRLVNTQHHHTMRAEHPCTDAVGHTGEYFVESGTVVVCEGLADSKLYQVCSHRAAARAAVVFV